MSDALSLIGGDPHLLGVLTGNTFALQNADGATVASMDLPESPASIDVSGDTLLVTHADETEAVISSYSMQNLQPFASVVVAGSWTATGTTHGRLILRSRSGVRVGAVKAAARSLTVSEFDLQTPSDFALPIDKPQILVTNQKKFETWDLGTLRASLRLGVAIPPAPRLVFTAQGHAGIVRTGTDAIVMYRLSDGRSFEHLLGSEVLQVWSHIGSPYVVVKTVKALLRVHCYAHSVVPISTPPATTLALLPAGDNTQLAGWAPGDSLPWRAPLNGQAHSQIEPATRRIAKPNTAAASNADVFSWREQLVKLHNAKELSWRAYYDAIATESTLMQWLDANTLSDSARAALSILYARYLVGHNGVGMSISELANIIDGSETSWREAIGHGQCAAHGVINWANGIARLAPAAGRYFDRAPSRNESAKDNMVARRGLYVLIDDRPDESLALSLGAAIGPLRWLSPYGHDDLLACHLDGVSAVVRKKTTALLDAPAEIARILVCRTPPGMPWINLPRITLQG
jgi:hypothetical protein